MDLSDKELWQQVTKNIRKLSSVKYTVHTTSLTQEPVMSPKALKELPVKNTAIARVAVKQQIDKPYLIPGHIPDVDKTLRNKFVSGDYKIDAKLDLHGSTENQAYQLLVAFVFQAIKNKQRCLLVITGKGKHPGSGVIKTSLPKWLNNEKFRSVILGFSPASVKHGGGGAMYILLKRQR